MILLILIVLLLFLPLGLGAVGAVVAASLWVLHTLFSQEMGVETPFSSISWLSAVYVFSIPLCVGLSVVLVERLSEVPGRILTLRASAALASLVLLASHSDITAAFLNAMPSQPSQASRATGLVALNLVALSQTVIFCAVLSALALTITQYLIRMLVVTGFRLGGVGVSSPGVMIPWGPISVMGAILIVCFLGQQFSAFFAHEFSSQQLGQRLERSVGP